MRYISSFVLATVFLVLSSTVAMACEMRSVIREQIVSRLGNIEINVDSKELEDKIHDMVHSQLDREKDKLRDERDKLRDERRKLERERRDLTRNRRRSSEDDDEEGSGWGASLALALGLYGAGLIFLNRRSKKGSSKNTE
ncbi:MAG: hypothetical protein HOH43_02810 [Candidatus Latescibacteria bacterium]|nr:hypothetical protein [Candidatus Latescibacterota bacterium]